MLDRLGWPPSGRILKGARQTSLGFLLQLGGDTFVQAQRCRCAETLGRGVDGRQYVAVSTGYGRFLDLTPELRPSSGNNLFVFALP